MTWGHCDWVDVDLKASSAVCSPFTEQPKSSATETAGGPVLGIGVKDDTALCTRVLQCRLGRKSSKVTLQVHLGGQGVSRKTSLRRAIELGLKGPVGVFQAKSGEQEGSVSRCGSAQVCDASVPGVPGILPLLPLPQPHAHPRLTRALGAQQQTSQAQSLFDRRP